MKTILLGLLAVLLGPRIGSGADAPQENGPAGTVSPAAQALVQKAVQAAGGEASLLTLFAFKDNVRLGEKDSGNGAKRESVLDAPRHWWLKAPGGYSEREDEPAKFLVWAWTLGALTSPASTIETVPDVTDGGMELWGLRVSGSVKPAMELYFSKANNLLARIDWRSDIHRFSEWTALTTGAKYPARTVGYKKDTGKSWYYDDVTEVTPLRELPEQLRPPALAPTEPRSTGKIHFIIGPSNHPPGTHEVAAGARLLKYCVDQANGSSMLSTTLHEGWPENPEAFADAKVIVFCGDQFPPVRFKHSSVILEQVSRLADRGCSFVAVHYAIGVNRPFADNASIRATLDRLFGGFANFIPVAEGGTVPRVMPATITPTKADHPVLRGVRPFSLRDEPYYKNWFAAKSPGSKVTPLATAMVPPEAPQEEVVAWSMEHERGGRGVAMVMPHFYRNWQNDDLRKLVLNGIFWAARAEIPASGMSSTLPGLATFQPVAVEPLSAESKAVRP